MTGGGSANGGDGGDGGDGGMHGRDTGDRASRALARMAVLGDLPPGEGSDLPAAALALARLARPELALAPYHAVCDLLAREVRDAAAGGLAADRALARVLAVEHGFAGDTDHYDDLDNADLARVIDRRRGLPVALGILWIGAARAQGWRAEGLDLPNHFLIRVVEPGDPVGLVLDPFHGGETLDPGRIEMLTGRRLDPGDPPRAVSDRSVLLRLQNNIKLRLLRAGDVEGGLRALAAMRRMAPDLGALALEQATVLVQAGAMRRAHDLLSGYLSAGHGDRSERRDIDRFLSALRSTLN